MINKLKNRKKGNRNWKDGGRREEGGGRRGDGGKKPTDVLPLDLRYNFFV